MTDKGQRNSQFLGRVWSMMREGYGYEDIAVRLQCSLETVRFEAILLRKEGRLVSTYNHWRKESKMKAHAFEPHDGNVDRRTGQ